MTNSICLRLPHNQIESCLWLITGFVTRVIRHVSLVEQGLRTHPEHLSTALVSVDFVLLKLNYLCSVLYVIICPFGQNCLFDLRLLILSLLVSSNFSHWWFREKGILWSRFTTKWWNFYGDIQQVSDLQCIVQENRFFCWWQNLIHKPDSISLSLRNGMHRKIAR